MRLLTIIAICLLFACISFTGNAQNDSVFFENQKDPTIGSVIVTDKKQTVLIRTSDGNKFTIGVEKISEIRLGSGKYYVTRKINSEPQMLILLVKGEFSLLYQGNKKLFYIEENGVMKVISHEHFKRALPVIFGEDLLHEYYAKFNGQPQYSAKYLKKLVSYFNGLSGSHETVYEENLRQFKTTVSIGPSLGFGYNRTAFDILRGYVEGKATYIRTGYFGTTSVPLGIRVNVGIFPRISLDLNVFINNPSSKKIQLENFGTYAVNFPSSILIPEKFDPDLKLKAFSFKTIHLDFSANYMLTRNGAARIRPYVFAGPTIARLTDMEFTAQAHFIDNPEDPGTYIKRSYQSQIKQYMVGFNAGLGVSYTLHKRITLNISGKFVGGIYPKIESHPVFLSEQNDTSAPKNAFGGFGSMFENRYDQYSRQIFVGASVVYRL